MSSAPTPAPGLRPVMRIEVHVTPPVSLGELAGLERRMIPIAGGTVHGSNFSGTILPGGSDVQSVRTDGTIGLVARYAADLGADGKLLIENTGIRRVAVAADGAAGSTYFRGIMRFSAAGGKLQWLNDSIFINTGMRDGGTVFLEVFEVV